MNLKECMNVLQKDIHSVVVSMIDEKGHPVSAYLVVMHADETGIYFLTSNNGRSLYHHLNDSDYISICGKTDGDDFHTKMINIQGRVRNIGKERIDALINENPYMKNLYPDHNLERRKIIDVFHVYEGSGTYQEFSIDRPVCEAISFTSSKQS